MISHTITFYTDDHDELVVKLINMGYGPLMATEKKSLYYFKTFKGEHRFWTFKFPGYIMPERLDEFWMDVDLCFGVPEGVQTDWDGVAMWLAGKSDELPLIKPVKLVSKQIYDERMEEEEMQLDQNYAYQERIEDGIFFAEITKPENGQRNVTPYTIVIEDWKPEKMIFMFSSICSVPSFGTLYPADRNFILSLWEFKGMAQKFDLQGLMDNHVKAVEHKQMHEPIVYRKSIGEVIDQFNDDRSDIGRKRKREEVPGK